MFRSTALLKLCNSLIHSSQHKNKDIPLFFTKQTFFDNWIFSFKGTISDDHYHKLILNDNLSHITKVCLQKNLKSCRRHTGFKQ